MDENLTGIKTAFTGGELAPSLYSRVDVKRYNISAKQLRNFIIQPHGSISNRPGFEYIATGKTEGKKIRMFPFEFSTIQTYTLEFGEYYIRFYTDGAVIEKDAGSAWTTATDYVVNDLVSSGGVIYICLFAHTSGVFATDLSNLKWEIETNKWVTATAYVVGDFVYTASKFYYCVVAHTSGVFATDLASVDWLEQSIYEVPTPYDEDDIHQLELKYTQSADVLYLAHPDYSPRQLERSGETSWALNDYDYVNGPFMLDNTTTTKTLAISAVSGASKTLTAVGFTFDEGTHVGSIWKLRHFIEGQANSAAIAGTGGETAIACGGTWRLITHGTWTGTIRVEKSTDGGSTWTNIREFSSADDFNPNTFGSEDMSEFALPFLVRVNCTAYTSGPCNINLTTDSYYHEGIVKITAITTGGATATATVIRTCGLTTATSDWAEGSWSDKRGWPSIVEFHPDDRLVWGNSYTEPQTFWMTKTGDYTNFARSDPLEDSDGISSPLPSRKVNGINGIMSLTEMIMLTLSNECSIQGTTGVITPTSLQNKIQGWEGSYGVKPVVIGNRGIYVQSIGSIIRDLGYVLDEGSFSGADLTIFSNHLFTGYSIIDLAYQQNPDRVVWAVRSDGKLLGMTYMREQEVVAWSPHDSNISGALEWVTATDYVKGNWVSHEGTDYLCDFAHTSGVFATDLTGSKWTATDREADFESACTIRGPGYDELWVSVNRSGTRTIERQVQRMVSTEPEDQFFVDCGSTYDGVATTTITGLTHLEGKTLAVLADGNVLVEKVVKSGVLTLGASYSKVTYGIGYVSDMETLNMDATLRDGTIQGKKIKVSKMMIRFINSRGGFVGPDADNLKEIHASKRSTYDDPLALFSGEQPVTMGGGYTLGGNIFFRQSQPLPVMITALIPQVSVGGMTQTI